MTARKKQSSEAAVREIRRRTRRRFSVEERIRNVLEGLRGELPAHRQTIKPAGDLVAAIEAVPVG